jgi:DNA repair exonuclease SbcCD ATPase subunit|tara:strand:- start:22 stop:744 length:723 start_codon:yes stop_codon:yes gene_type:complete
MSAPVVETTPETTTETFSEPASETMNAPAAEENVDNREELMKLVIDQESELSGTKTALERAQSELQKLQSAWSERENNEKLQTKSKAEALSKALVDSWTASLPADMMTDDNKKAIYALAQNFPQESVKMMEIAHKASKKYKQDLDSLAAQQQVKQKRALESRVHDIVTKKRRIAAPDTRSVVHAASVKKANPFAFDASRTSSSAMSGVRDRNPDLFKALSGFSSGNLRDRMGQIANINGN